MYATETVDVDDASIIPFHGQKDGEDTVPPQGVGYFFERYAGTLNTDWNAT